MERHFGHNIFVKLTLDMYETLVKCKQTNVATISKWKKYEKLMRKLFFLYP